MKRFRLSHIIEVTLQNHIQKNCGLELDRIYWRFPIKEASQHAFTPDRPETIIPAGAIEAEKKALHSTDEYINEGLVPYKDVPNIEVTELSWEKFQEASTASEDPKIESVTPPKKE
jgi:hypothetical protein